MKVLVHADIFASREVPQLEIYRLFEVCRDGRHRLLIYPDPSPAFDSWLDKQARNTRDECRLVIEQSIRDEASEPPSRTIRIKPSGAPDWVRGTHRLPFPLAVRILKSPLDLLVENHRNDLNFLRAVARGGHRARFELALQKEWLRVQHGGGIPGVRSQIQTVSSGVRQQLKMWVLFDRDGLRPGHESRESARLRELCEKRSLSHHQLRRRTIENYLPREALQAWWHRQSKQAEKKRIRKLVESYLSLSEDQRHFFNLRRGFERDQRRKDQHEVGDLYADVSDEKKAVLANGLSASIAELFDPQTSGPFDEKWLIRDGQGPEIDAMLDHLLNLV